MLAVGIVVGINFANRVSPAASQAPITGAVIVGEVAPAFSVATTQGPYSLVKNGHPILLEVFATWCPHCQRETAVLNALYDEYRGRVNVVAVSGSEFAADRRSPSSLADVLDFVQYFHVRYPVAYDGTLSVAKSYLQSGYPTIAIIGTDLRIRYLGAGEIARSTLESEIRGALAK